MPFPLTMRARAFAPALVALALAACNADDATRPTDPGVLGPLAAGRGVAACTPARDYATAGKGLVPDPVLVSRCSAQPGDLIDAALVEFRPTQPSLGYDEVYYKLGRYRSNKDELNGDFNKRFDDWCEANGQEEAASVAPGARLDDPSTFTCTVAVGSETPATIALMKTAVIGPLGQLYLTDGHHTFTSFWETADGGPDMHVRVRVEGNLSNLSTAQFWQEMQRRQWVWLFDGNDRPITPQQLPRQLGLSEFGNDPYRGALYFARDIGYVQLPENAIFQEFYWGRWLRENADPALALSAYDLNDLSSYLALVKAVSQAMSALDDAALVSGGKTALELGKLTPWNDGAAETAGEFGKLSKPFSNSKPGKLAYALDYKLGVLAAAN